MSSEVVGPSYCDILHSSQKRSLLITFERDRLVVFSPLFFFSFYLPVLASGIGLYVPPSGHSRKDVTDVPTAQSHTIPDLKETVPPASPPLTRRQA